ncbi:Bifunctional solanapyrone synthase [Cyphellophora attinorum]|uniref:Bifunctional solanapyrone synthase n=1 Tax=Cyphellophora attinorum TaxID=1664694 RepID=A0A0N0NNV7_9EURO|nr:Bifunctional solanapyrone synthase [Phialophora attinorum]KPI41998.1 Bifunctional solanapyrone synthase [Phialophora attinorum]
MNRQYWKSTTTLQPVRRKLAMPTQCQKLACVFPDQVVFPNSTVYEGAESHYWSVQQSELRPTCRFFPDGAQDVRSALQIAQATNTSVAVVSGGHSSNVNASNIDHGMTMDLAALSNIVVSEDRASVWLGPAAIWSEVYAALEPHGLTVPGGRVGHVGVGGYVLGGGFSWYANTHGWSCDNVLDFVVVTPDLRILHVNSSAHADLFWALKGSLGAFGVVTGIRMQTSRNAGFYGGGISYSDEALPAVYVGLSNLAYESETTPIHLATSPKQWSHNVYLINTANSSESSANGDFRMIPNKGHNQRHMSPRQSADEIAESNPLGYRRSKFTITTLATVEIMNLTHQYVRGFVEDGLKLSSDEFFGITFQPITSPHLQAQGQNIFSDRLRLEWGPLLLISIELWWKDPTRDAFFENEMKGLCEDGLEFFFMWMRVLHPWVYPNYAASWQDALSAERLGKDFEQRLAGVRQSYDAQNLWQGMVPGIWHV